MDIRAFYKRIKIMACFWLGLALKKKLTGVTGIQDHTGKLKILGDLIGAKERFFIFFVNSPTLRIQSLNDIYWKRFWIIKRWLLSYLQRRRCLWCQSICYYQYYRSTKNNYNYHNYYYPNHHHRINNIYRIHHWSKPKTRRRKYSRWNDRWRDCCPCRKTSRTWPWRK